VLAAVIIPIVVIILLAIWLLLVYRANRRGGEGGHPETANPRAVPRREVAGGAFRSRGGRQVMPRREEMPAEAVSVTQDDSMGRPSAEGTTNRDPAGRPPVTRPGLVLTCQWQCGTTKPVHAFRCQGDRRSLRRCGGGHQRR
jgi:hypothetical protein